MEKIKSSRSTRRRFSCIIGETSATIAVSVYRMRRTSLSSSILNRDSSSYIFATLTGSMKKVLPVEDLSITLPGIRNLYSFFTGTQMRPFRRV